MTGVDDDDDDDACPRQMEAAQFFKMLGTTH